MKILYVTTISLTMNSFFKPHIEMLVREGNHVDIACNCNDLALDNLYSQLGCDSYQIDFSRSPLSKENIRAYGQLKKVIENGNYDIVHCHTPNASVITRLVCRKFRKKNGLKVFYTAHGFHFYRGAPKINWLVYYPIEKFCSRFTDKLITINKEDFELAKSKFKAKEVHYVPGVGVDLSRFQNVSVDKAAKRRELGIPEDARALLSIGELSWRKNHQVIIQSMSQLNMDDLYYIIAGIGNKMAELKQLIANLGLSHRIFLLEYREDIPELCYAADVFCFPSYQEGLPVSVMEAMACGLPCVVSRIRGNTDLITEEGGAFFNPHSVDDCSQAIRKVLDGDMVSMGKTNREKSAAYSIHSIMTVMKSIYES